MKRVRVLVGCCATAMAMLAAGCGEERAEPADGAGQTATAPTSPQEPPPPTEGGPQEFPANGKVEEVLSLDNNFILQTVEVPAGTEIRWVNNGRNDHNIIPEGDPELTAYGVLQDGFHPGDTYSHVFTTPGTYVYYCSIHGTSTAGMFGTIIVTEP